MNLITGTLHKMSTTLCVPVAYHLTLNNELISLNQLLGQKITFTYLDEIYCIHCGRKTRKSFQQGYCFLCYRQLLECNLCTIHPEKCRFYEKKCNPEHWAHAHCCEPHIIYLANSSGLKVGITRQSQESTRWIDQGATQALPILHTKNRYQAGLIEVILKNDVADRTQWQVMLRKDPQALDLLAKRDEILNLANRRINMAIEQYPLGEISYCPDAKVTEIQYPILQYPQKIKALSFDKTNTIEGVLQGIKGQYLIFDCGVINIRKFAGYKVTFVVEKGTPASD